MGVFRKESQICMINKKLGILFSFYSYCGQRVTQTTRIITQRTKPVPLTVFSGKKSIFDCINRAIVIPKILRFQVLHITYYYIYILLHILLQLII